MGGRWVVALLLAVGFWGGGAGWTPADSADEVEVELVGFLSGLPAGGLRPPVPAGTTARLEVPSEQGGARVVFTVEVTPRTELSGEVTDARGDPLVVLEGVLQADRLRVRRLSEVDVAEYDGRISLREGPLELPVAADRLVEVFLDDGSGLPLTFLLTPRTASRQRSLRDGQPVTLAVVNGRRLVVGIEASGAR